MFLNDLIIRGGPVLYILFILTLIIFYILFNKYFFIFVDKKVWTSKKIDDFVILNPPESTKLFFVEKTFLSEYRRDSFSNIKLLDGLIGMCPMIGLLGTVYGMIEVFEVLILFRNRQSKSYVVRSCKSNDTNNGKHGNNIIRTLLQAGFGSKA